ncbi:hypothetical protein WBP07_17335 [Novosphingobium sp. BL-8A]|uniref:hypothetical protein n=1 Tax=Novosphingobium sp. BL-8A TaxID=3127639 RepID=UPI0037581149
MPEYAPILVHWTIPRARFEGMAKATPHTPTGFTPLGDFSSSTGGKIGTGSINLRQKSSRRGPMKSSSDAQNMRLSSEAGLDAAHTHLSRRALVGGAVGAAMVSPSSHAQPGTASGSQDVEAQGAFKLSTDGTVTRSIVSKLREQVSVLDYIPSEHHAAIRSGDSRFDCANAFQQAINENLTITVPDGTYLVGTTIREKTNGGARSIIGQSRLNTRIMAAPNLAHQGMPIFWFGNNSGHGNYRLRFQHLSLNGAGDQTNGAGGAIGIRAQECGTSVIGDLYISRCQIAIDAIGCIGASFGGEKTEIMACEQGLWHSAPNSGKPTGPDDITLTASPLSLKDNANRASNFWFSKVARPVRLMGGLSHLGHVVLQSCGSGTSDDLIHLLSANESYDYGGGPTLSDIWCEGGNYRSIIRVEHTRDARIRKIFLSGAGTTSEQGIVVINSKGCRVDDVAARGSWLRSPTEERSGNHWLHVDSTSSGGVFGPFYFTQNSCTYYIDRTAPRHNHIIIDNHRADTTTQGIIVGPIQISGSTIQKDPAIQAKIDLQIHDFDVYAEHELRVQNKRVVGPQQPAIADAKGGRTIDAEARTALHAILSSLRQHGLISSE